MKSPLHRRASVVAVWLAGSVVAVAVAIAAIGLAGARVTGHTTMLQARDAADRTAGTLIDPLSVEAPPTSAPVEDTTPQPGGDTSTSVPASVVPGATPSPGNGHGSSSPTTAVAPGGDEKPSPGESPTTTQTSPPTTTPSSPSSSKTSVVVGGTVKVQCINSSVSLVSAVPNAGFGVEVGSHGPQQVEVQFHRDNHESQVTATCRAGVITFVNEESAGAA
jgi:hypothetical protein